MKIRIALISLLITIVGLQSTNAQKGFALEVNGGAAFALSDLNEAELGTGIAFEGLLRYNFHQHIGIYAGWGWTHFNAEEILGGLKLEFEETGYRLGLEFNNAINESIIGYYVRAAALYNHIEAENSNGQIVGDSGHGFGWQAGLGMTLDLGTQLQLRPGLRYQSLSKDIEYESIAVMGESHLQYLAATLGIVVKL